MNKKEALTILIQNTSVFSEEIKNRLLNAVPHMSDEDVDDIGMMLAGLKSIDREECEKEIQALDALLEKLVDVEVL